MSRRLTAEPMNAVAVRRHARLAGEVIWAWNELHASFNHLFSGLVDPDNLLMGMRLWTAIANETAQREMLREAVECTRGLSNSDKASIAWVIKQADRLAVYRNDIIHGQMGFTIRDTGVFTSMSYLGNAHSRIVRHGVHDLTLDELMKSLRGDLMALAGYAMGVARSGMKTRLLTSDFIRPRRPRLKTVLLLEEGKRRARELADEWGD